jgi:acyl dehydratase
MVDGVSDEKLRRYREVCGFAPVGPMPVTYPHILASSAMFRLMRGRDFPLPLLGLVHIGNVIEQTRPLSTSDKVELTVAWANLRDHARGRAVDVVTVATMNGRAVWRERSAYLRRMRGAPRASEWSPADDQIPTPRQTWRVGRDTATAYARISGDRNPIHTSTVAARLFGFPGRIAHGMWSLARCLAALEGELPETYTVDVSFKLPVVLPAEVAFSTSLDPAGPGRFELRDASSGKPHLAGQVDLVESQV